MKGIVYLLVAFALVAGVTVLGASCLAYDINHIAATFLPGTPHLAWSRWPVLIGGLVLSETAVPLAIVIWCLVTIGVMR